MKVLLVNPNRYKSPPVPPIGLEYIAASLEEKGHAAEIVDTCFSEDPCLDIDNAIEAFRPDIAGITIRNVDSVLYYTNEFFLDEIKDIVNHIKSHYGLKVVIGGTGVSASPEGILEYLNADYAIAGPAENTFNEVLERIQSSTDARKVYHGKYNGNISCHRQPSRIDFKRYCDAGGVVGFETHKGCSSSCIYCLEANSRVSFKDPGGVVKEIKSFVDTGYDHFHLCDSEFNESLEYSAEFCNALKMAGLDMKWALYMKPGNSNKKLFRLLKETGAYLITLTVDSYKKCTEYWTEIEKSVFGAKSCGLKTAVDFLTGFPYEKDDDIRWCLDFLRRLQPDSVGINTFIRLYKSLQITKIILNDGKLKDSLLGDTCNNTFLKPVFFNHIDIVKLEHLIDGDPLFRIEGLEKGVNYSRV